MSDTGSTGSTGSNDPYDPNRPASQPDQSGQPDRPSQPDQPQWGASPPPPGPGYGQQPPYGQQPAGPYGQQPQYGYGQGGYAQPAGTPPPNYLVWAILSTLFCCLPLGIASIVFAAQVNGKYQAGDLQGAMESSRKAKQFAIWSAAVGVVLVVLYVLLIVVASVGNN